MHNHVFAYIVGAGGISGSATSTILGGNLPHSKKIRGLLPHPKVLCVVISHIPNPDRPPPLLLYVSGQLLRYIILTKDYYCIRLYMYVCMWEYCCLCHNGFLWNFAWKNICEWLTQENKNFVIYIYISIYIYIYIYSRRRFCYIAKPEGLSYITKLSNYR